MKKGGYIYICVPGMKKDMHDNLPEELVIVILKINPQNAPHKVKKAFPLSFCIPRECIACL